MWPLAVETNFDDGPVSSSPSADWIKLLVAPESNIASLMALTSLMASSMNRSSVRRSSVRALCFASCRVHFDEGWGPVCDSQSIG